jgi:hypothetical protein
MGLHPCAGNGSVGTYSVGMSEADTSGHCIPDVSDHAPLPDAPAGVCATLNHRFLPALRSSMA